MADTNLISVEDRQDFIEGVYSGKYGPGVIPPAIYMRTGEILLEEVFKGFGRSFFDATIAQGDLDWLKSTHENVYLFSGCKTQRQALDLQKAAVDPDGFLRPFRDYKKVALEIDRAYNLNWLGTEMRTAFALSQSASQWKDIERVKGVFSHLRYITKEDDHVRQSHRPLNNIVRPVDDPFWDTHFPPVDWNCRCTFEQLRKSEVPKRVGRIDKTVNEVPSPLFRFNPGKKGIVFDKSHPYFEDVLARYPYLKQITPPPPPPPPAQRVIPDPPRLEINKDQLSPVQRFFKLIGKEEEVKDLSTEAFAALNIVKRDLPIEFNKQTRSALVRTVRRATGEELSAKISFGTKKTPNGERLWWDESRVHRHTTIHHEIGHGVHRYGGAITEEVVDESFEREWRKSKAFFYEEENWEKLRDYDLRLKRLGDAIVKEYQAPKERLLQIVKSHGFDVDLPDWSNGLDIISLSSDVRDHIEAITGGRLGAGHGSAYYSQKHKPQFEAFAHLSANHWNNFDNPFFGGVLKDHTERMTREVKRIIDNTLNS